MCDTYRYENTATSTNTMLLMASTSLVFRRIRAIETLALLGGIGGIISVRWRCRKLANLETERVENRGTGRKLKPHSRQAKLAVLSGPVACWRGPWGANNPNPAGFAVNFIYCTLSTAYSIYCRGGTEKSEQTAMGESQNLQSETVNQLRALAHDLSNSIETIMQASYLLAQAKLEDDNRRWLDLIDKAVQDAARFSREIREILRAQN